MDKLIAAFPDNIREALQIAKNSTFQNPKNEIRQVVVCGMGGSGIGGELVKNWTQNEIKVPVLCYHDYNAPAFIDKQTLVIASSYSGNTEETLMFVEGIQNKGAHIIGVCSGGDLQTLCNKNGYDCIIVPGGNPPRAALAYSIIQVSNILTQLGLISDSILTSFASSKTLIENNIQTIKDKATELAKFLRGSVPVFYASAAYEAALIRAKQQFNENTKMLCWTNVIPEMNHNELVGWGGGDHRFSAVYFDTNDISIRNKKRADITFEVIASKTNLMTINIAGADLIERSMYLIHIVDWASFILAEMDNTDAMDIKIINRLKSELANIQQK